LLRKTGKVQALAVTTAKRFTLLPDVPTMIESGIPDYEVSTWYSVLVPALTPQPVVARLNSELAKLAAIATTRQQFTAQGLDPAHTSPAQARAHLEGEIGRWGKVIKAAGVKPN
jgi:tripartite-type tricarboxylate transporter receptor subunit TctC